MFLVGIFQWWYGAGWLRHVRRSYVGILRTADFFSLGLLLRTLFDPFRQISAANVNGPLPEQLRAWADRQFSRAVGAVVRTIMLLVGMVAITARALWTLVSIVSWTLLPLTPVIGIFLWVSGVTLR